MPGAVYETALELTTKGDFSSKLDNMNDALGKLSFAAADVGSKLSDAFAGAVENAAALVMHMGKLGAIGIAGGLAYGVASLNAGLEKTQVSLAAIFNANGVVNGMGDGMELSSEMMKKMRRDAAELPGEFKDLEAIFRNMVIPGTRSGMDVSQIEGLSAKAMAAAAASGVPMEVAAREMGMILAGRVTSHMPVAQMLGLTGDDATKFKGLSQVDRGKDLEKRLDKYGESIKVFSATWDAVTSTMVDNAKVMVGAVTKPLFDALKGTLDKGNQWFSAHQAKIESWAGYIGTKIADAFSKGQSILEQWWPALVDFATVFEQRFVSALARVEPIVHRIAGAFGKMLKDPEGTLDKMTMLGGLYGMSKLAVPAAEGIMGAAGAAGVGATAATGIGVALLGILAGMASAIYVVTDATAWMHDEAVVIWDDIKLRFLQTGAVLEEAFSKAEPYIMKAVSGVGVLFLAALDGVADAAFAAAGAIKWITDQIVDMIDSLKRGVQTGKDSGGGYMWDQLLGALDDAPDKADKAAGRAATKAFMEGAYEGNSRAGGANAKAPPKEAPQGHGTHIDKVEITVSGSDDPSRVARIVEQRLSELSRNPRASRYTPNYSGSR